MRLIILMLLLFVGCEKPKQQTQKKDQPIPVVIAKAEKADVPIYIETIGTVFAKITVQLKPQVQGQIIATHVMEGQYVKKGDLLYTIDPDIFQAEVDKAEAVLEKDKAQTVFAKQKLERYSQLKEKEFVSALTLEELESNVKALEAQVMGDEAALELAKINREHCDVKSPIDGKISQFLVDVGNLVKAFDDRALTEILQINPIEIRFSFPQKDFLEIKKYYNKGTLTFLVKDPTEQSPDKEGRVEFLDNKIDTQTGTILLKGIVENRRETFWPGAFVRVSVYLRTDKDVVVVPSASVTLGQKGPYVFVINNDQKAELRLVTTGATFESKIVIEKGVTAGEQVVVDGQLNLKNGSSVILKQGNG